MGKKNADCRLGGILQQIYKIDVALESDHSSKKELLICFLRNFKDYCIQKNVLFAKYFRHFYLTGSYFQGLRVKEATEFDVNVAFDFPFGDFNYVVSELSVLPSFVTLQLKSPEDFKNIPFFDSKRYLLKQNILKWFQSLLDSFMNSHNVQYPNVLWMKTSNSGPARTVKILYKSVWISIDLVPVFSLNLKYLKEHSVYDDCLEIPEEMSTVYIVPKPLKPKLSHLLPPCMSERVWRIHFAEAEEFMLRKKKNLKHVIKLVKALRDKECWPIPSYFLNVVAFWLVKSHPKDVFWNHIDTGALFLLFLEALEGHFSAQYLGHIFYPRFNLFHSFSQTHLRSLQKRMHKIIQQLKRKPSSAFILFKIMYMPYTSLAPSLLHY